MLNLNSFPQQQQFQFQQQAQPLQAHFQSGLDMNCGQLGAGQFMNQSFGAAANYGHQASFANLGGMSAGCNGGY